MKTKNTAALPKTGEIEALIAPAAEDAQKALAICERLSVTTAGEAEIAAGVLREVAQKRDEIDGLRKRWVEPLKSVAKEIDAAFRPAIKSLEAAEAAIKGLLAEYSRAEEARRVEAARKLEAAAAEARRVEAARVAAEAAEETRRVAELQRANGPTPDELAAEEARRVEAARRSAEMAAAARRAEAERAAAMAAVAAAAPAKIDGVSMRREWSGEVVDAGLLPREYMRPDTAKLEATTKALGADPGIPGWRAFQVEKVRTSRRADS